MVRGIIDIFDQLSNPNPERILIIKPSSLGDVVHTLPAVASVKERFPEAELSWLVNTEWAPILEGNPKLNSVIQFPRKQWKGWRDLGKARKWARENLSSLKPDLSIDFQGLLRSGLLARSSGASEKLGFRQAREGAGFFYDFKVDIPDWRETHAVDRYLRLVSGPTGGEMGFDLPSGTEIPAAETPEVLIHPFSRGKGKSLSFSEVVDFCAQLPSKRIGIVGAGFHWPDSVTLPSNAVDFLNKSSLSELIWLMRSAKFIVSVDSGPMHLAAGITDNILSIHTWTNPLMVGPYPKDAWIFRDGKILRVSDVEIGQFPEERDKKNDFPEGKPLLKKGWIERISDHVDSELST